MLYVCMYVCMFLYKTRVIDSFVRSYQLGVPSTAAFAACSAFIASMRIYPTLDACAAYNNITLKPVRDVRLASWQGQAFYSLPHYIPEVSLKPVDYVLKSPNESQSGLRCNHYSGALNLLNYTSVRFSHCVLFHEKHGVKEVCSLTPLTFQFRLLIYF